MPHWRTMIEKEYLAAWDLVVPGTMTPKDYTLKIASVQSQILKTKETPKGKRRCTVRFVRTQKAWVANSTNCEIIEGMYGGDTDGWVGKLVTLYQGDVRSPKGNGTVKGIKVRPQMPKGQAESVAAAPVDEGMRREQNEAFDREPEREPGAEG